MESETTYVDLDLTRFFKKINQLETFDSFHLAELPKEVIKNVRVSKLSKDDFIHLLDDISLELIKYRIQLSALEDKDEK